MMNRSAKGGARSSLRDEAKAFSFAHHGKVIAGGTVRKNSDVTSGELTGSAGGTGVSRPISASEVASDAQSVVGRLSSTMKRGESRVTGNRRAEVGRGRPAGDDGWEARGSQMSKDEGGGTVP